MEKEIMTEEVFDKKLEVISKSLEPCPICKQKADIEGAHTVADDIIIDAVGCMRCNLILRREMKWSSDPKKIFPKRRTNIVDVVQTWNSRVTN